MNISENRERRTQAQRRATTRRALLDAARSVFAEKGYHGAAAEEIVRRAGLTRGALYHHFEDKRDLFRAVIDEMESEIDEEIEEAEQRAHSDLPEAVMAGYRAFIDAVLDPEMRGTFFLDGPSVLGWEWREIDARHAVGKIEEGLEALMAEGFMEVQPVGPLARLINGALLEGAFYVAGSDDPEGARDEVWEAMERLLGGLIDRRSGA